MKKIYFLPMMALAVFLLIRSAGGIEHKSVLLSPPSPPTTTITPPKNSQDSFQVSIPAGGNAVFISFNPMIVTNASPKVWVGGSPVYISTGSKYRIAPSQIPQVTGVVVKYNGGTQSYFDQVSALASGPYNAPSSSYTGTYSNNAPNADRAIVVICDSAACTN